MGPKGGRSDTQRVVGRRAALQQMGGIAVALCTSACSRSLVLQTIYPETRALEDDAVEALLAAFVDTVVPGVAAPERVARLMQDPALPFEPYSKVLAAELARRARASGARAAFDRLPLEQRTAIVADGLDGGGIPSRVFNGGVLFAQAAVYGGLTSDDGSCSITGFEGPFRFRGYAAQTYPDPERFLPASVSTDGNPW